MGDPKDYLNPPPLDREELHRVRVKAAAEPPVAHVQDCYMDRLVIRELLATLDAAEKRAQQNHFALQDALDEKERENAELTAKVAETRALWNRAERLEREVNAKSKAIDATEQKCVALERENAELRERADVKEKAAVMRSKWYLEEVAKLKRAEAALETVRTDPLITQEALRFRGTTDKAAYEAWKEGRDAD